MSSALYLASNSPRRRELLSQIGVRFEQFSVDIDETPQPAESPENYVLRMTEQKSRAAQLHLERTKLPKHPVLCADTTVVFGGEILGKPSCAADAASMLRRLSDGEHQVMSSVALSDDQRTEIRISKTRVTFTSISEQQIVDYWRSGEPADKAGGYAIQGLGAVFVKAISGSYSGVVGLPLAETTELLEAFTVPYWVY